MCNSHKDQGQGHRHEYVTRKVHWACASIPGKFLLTQSSFYISYASPWQVKEDPAEPEEPVRTSETNDWHLANPDKESITFVIHGADNLPPTRKGHVPNPYVIM